jgi:hypothetical protein
MDDVAQRISTILANRKTQLPLVQSEISLWQGLDQELVRLGKAVADFSAHPKTPAEVRDELGRLPFAQLHNDIETAVSMLRTVETRFSRGTINTPSNRFAMKCFGHTSSRLVWLATYPLRRQLSTRYACPSAKRTCPWNGKHRNVARYS